MIKVLFSWSVTADHVVLTWVVYWLNPFLFLQTIHHTYKEQGQNKKNETLLYVWHQIVQLKDSWGDLNVILGLTGHREVRWTIHFNNTWVIPCYVSRITSHVTKGQWRQMKEGIVGYNIFILHIDGRIGFQR